MDVVQKYYAELRRILDEVDPAFAAEFSAYAASHRPNETWMWLDDKMAAREFPSELRKCMEDFYWMIR